jgi:cell shape-determining protein MreC
MTMSQYHNKINKNIRTIILSIFVLFLAFVTVSWLRAFRGSVPPLYTDVVSLSTRSKQSLIKKVLELQTTIDSQNSSLVAMSVVKSENESLKKELGRSGSVKGTIARVIVPPNRSIYDTLVIDAGSESAIEIGQKVYAFGSIAIGTITDVLEDTSTVTLYSAPNRETVGTTTGSDIAVTLIGRGSGEYEVRMPRDVVFEQGGVISQQSLSVHPLATIQKIITDARDPFQRLLAKAPVNLQTMKWVIVK